MASQHATRPLAGTHARPCPSSAHWAATSRRTLKGLLLVQDTPGDAAAAYLARLQTTEQVLTAVRQAGAAKSRLQSGQGPVAHQALSLTESGSVRLLRNEEWDPALCDHFELSACGNWLALGLIAAQAEQPLGFFSRRYLHKLAVYSVPGFQLQAVLGCGDSGASIQWAPAAPLLSLALRPFPRDPGAVGPQMPAACIVDAETGAVLSSLSANTLTAAVALAARSLSPSASWAGTFSFELPPRPPAWSCCGTRVLIDKMTSKGRGSKAGVLLVFDLVQDQQVLETQYLCKDWAGPPARWHPSLMAVILGPDVSVHAPEAFAQAGMALGWLPAPTWLKEIGPGFSPDGRLYCAWSSVEGPGGEYDHYWLFACSQQDHSVMFTPVRDFPDQTFRWTAAGCLAVVYEPATCFPRDSSARLRDLAAQTELYCLDNLPSEMVSKRTIAPNFSPSHKFVGEAVERLRILCVQTGVQLWDGSSPALAAEHLWLPGGVQDFSACGEHLRWLPSGRGVICLGLAPFGGAPSLHSFLFS